MTLLKWTMIAIAVTCLSIAAAHAFEFLEKRNCTLTFRGRPALHTTCVIKGGMQGGSIDITIRTPDGKLYALDGPIDGEEGHKFLLQKHPASKTSLGDHTCYARNDGMLALCL
jgi:hypothetical protein